MDNETCRLYIKNLGNLSTGKLLVVSYFLIISMYMLRPFSFRNGRNIYTCIRICMAWMSHDFLCIEIALKTNILFLQGYNCKAIKTDLLLKTFYEYITAIS